MEATIPRPLPDTLSVAAAGPWSGGEFRAVRAAIDPGFAWPSWPGLSAVCEVIEAGGGPPEVLLLAQPRPGCMAASEVERLRRQAPLTRLIVVAGSWCEGELRSGTPLTGVVRLYWHELPAWWRAANERRLAGWAPPWSQPLLDLRAGQAIDGSPAPTADVRTVLIDAADHETFRTLAMAIAPAAWRGIWRQRSRPERATPYADGPITAGIWCGGQLDGDEPGELASFCRECAKTSAPVLALLDYPRWQHVAEIEAAGAAAMLGKPYQVSLLLNELDRIAAQSHPEIDRHIL